MASKRVTICLLYPDCPSLLLMPSFITNSTSFHFQTSVPPLCKKAYGHPTPRPRVTSTGLPSCQTVILSTEVTSRWLTPFRCHLTQMLSPISLLPEGTQLSLYRRKMRGRQAPVVREGHNSVLHPRRGSTFPLFRNSPLAQLFM